jgi:hypothetical protein
LFRIPDQASAIGCTGVANTRRIGAPLTLSALGDKSPRDKKFLFLVPASFPNRY